MEARGFILAVPLSIALSSKRSAGLKMRTGRRDHLEIARLLKRLNEEDEIVLSQLCGNYAELPTVLGLNRHTIRVTGLINRHDSSVHLRTETSSGFKVQGVWLMVRDRAGSRRPMLDVLIRLRAMDTRFSGSVSPYNSSTNCHETSARRTGARLQTIE